RRRREFLHGSLECRARGTGARAVMREQPYQQLAQGTLRFGKTDAGCTAAEQIAQLGLLGPIGIEWVVVLSGDHRAVFRVHFLIHGRAVGAELQHAEHQHAHEPTEVFDLAWAQRSNTGSVQSETPEEGRELAILRDARNLLPLR